MQNLLLSIILLTCVQNVASQDCYSTYFNDFAPFGKIRNSKNVSVAVSENLFCVKNESTADVLETDTIVGGAKVFKFYVRMANKNNQESKSYKCHDENGGEIKIKNPSWGVVWNYKSASDYYAVTMNCKNSNLHDILDHRSMDVTVWRMKSGIRETLKTINMDDGVNLSDGMNGVCVEYDGRSTTVSVGNKEMRAVAEVDGVDYSEDSEYGYMVGAGSDVHIERMVMKSKPLMKKVLGTQWTKASLDEYLAHTKNFIEGYWNYLDRKIDEHSLRLGGRYTIALVGNSRNGYDIIYVAGAKVNGGEWECGMKKGELTNTQFSNNFDLIWYDAMMSPFNVDVYATIENNVILTLKFPIQGSQLRFAKVVK